MIFKKSSHFLLSLFLKKGKANMGEDVGRAESRGDQQDLQLRMSWPEA